MQHDAHIYFQLVQACKCIYMAEYGHIYSYIHYFGTQEVRKTFSQCIPTQKASAHRTKLIQLRCSATQLPSRGP